MAPYKSRKYPRRAGQLFGNLNNDEDVIRSQHLFLRDVWSDFTRGSFTFLAFQKAATGKWIDHAIEHSDLLSDVPNLLRRYPRWDYDQYFCPNAFSEPRRMQQYAIPTPFSWCDMDESDPDVYDPRPSLVWKTSPRHYQALWLWDKTHKANEAEQFSKSLTIDTAETRTAGL